MKNGRKKRNLLQFATVSKQKGLEDENKDDVTHRQEFAVHLLELSEDRHAGVEDTGKSCRIG